MAKVGGTGKRRSASQLARDRRKIADLYLQGWLQTDIAEELGMSQATISNDIKALQAEWVASAKVDFATARAQELAKIDRLEREYWHGWVRSCEDAEQITQEGTSENVSKIKRTRKGQAGDTRFLQGIQWCVERRCKILGVDAPVERKYEIGPQLAKAIEALPGEFKMQVMAQLTTQLEDDNQLEGGDER
jgi:hypothetical protein